MNVVVDTSVTVVETSIEDVVVSVQVVVDTSVTVVGTTTEVVVVS